jgi:hypothetical protein
MSPSHNRTPSEQGRAPPQERAASTTSYRYTDVDLTMDPVTINDYATISLQKITSDEQLPKFNTNDANEVDDLAGGRRMAFVVASGTNLSEMISEMKKLLGIKDAAINKLNVNLAVLENEVRRAREECVDVRNTVVSLAKLLASADPTNLAELKVQIESLRRENAMLWKRIEGGSCRMFCGAEVGGEHLDATVCAQKHQSGHTRANSFNITKSKGKEFVVVEEDGIGISTSTSTANALNGWGHSKFNVDHSSGSESNPPTVTSHPVVAHNGLSVSKVSSSNSNCPTVPNSPIIAPQKTSSPTVNAIGDVGMHSLEEILGSNTSDSGVDVSILAAQVKQIDLDAEGPGIDVEVKEQMKQYESLDNLPAPVPLKTGIATSGIKGAEYDYTKPAARTPHFSCEGPSFGQGKSHAGFPTDLFDSEEHFIISRRSNRRFAGDGVSGRRATSDPQVFTHGISYTPSTGTKFRTVLINKVPVNVNLRELLQKVKGGAVVDGSIVDTVAWSGSKTAIIHFFTEFSAESYVSYVYQNPITLGEDEDAVQATVTLIETPTYPMSNNARLDILQKGHTRMLSIPNFPYNQFDLSQLEKNVAPTLFGEVNPLLEIFISELGTLHLEFASVRAASQAYQNFTTFHCYKHLNVRFDRDSCDAPVQELALPTKSRPPMFPPNIQPDNCLFGGQDAFSSSINKQVVGIQRKHLAALNAPIPLISSFSGANLLGPSWADETNDELEYEIPGAISKPAATSQANFNEHGRFDGLDRTIMADNFNRTLKEGSFRKQPVGLSGSKYANSKPVFQDREPALQRRGILKPVAEFKHSQEHEMYISDLKSLNILIKALDDYKASIDPADEEAFSQPLPKSESESSSRSSSSQSNKRKRSITPAFRRNRKAPKLSVDDKPTVSVTLVNQECNDGTDSSTDEEDPSLKDIRSFKLPEPLSLNKVNPKDIMISNEGRGIRGNAPILPPGLAFVHGEPLSQRAPAYATVPSPLSAPRPTRPCPSFIHGFDSTDDPFDARYVPRPAAAHQPRPARFTVTNPHEIALNSDDDDSGTVRRLSKDRSLRFMPDEFKAQTNIIVPVPDFAQPVKNNPAVSAPRIPVPGLDGAYDDFKRPPCRTLREFLRQTGL